MPATKPSDLEFVPIGKGSLDSKLRLTLARAAKVLADLYDEEVEGLSFEISINKAGEILLSPAAAIPLHEAWLYRNPAALASVRRGVDQAKRGRVKKIGTFAQYADEDVD